MISKEELETLIQLRMSLRHMAKELNCSCTTIRYWVKKYDLEVNKQPKVTDNELASAVSQSKSLTEVMRALGKFPRGNLYRHYRKRCDDLGLDTSHFQREYVSIGARSHWSEILVDGQRRENSAALRKALFEHGMAYVCSWCLNNGSWRGGKLILQIDHINGQPTDNRPENLRFLCPNCHTQTETYGQKPLHLR